MISKNRPPTSAQIKTKHTSQKSLWTDEMGLNYQKSVFYFAQDANLENIGSTATSELSKVFKLSNLHQIETAEKAFPIFLKLTSFFKNYTYDERSLGLLVQSGLVQAVCEVR